MKRDVVRKDIRSYLPTLPTAQVASRIEGGIALHRDLRDAFASLRQNSSQVRADARVAKQQAVNEGQAALQSQAGASLERGMLGSTLSNIQRALVRRDTASTVTGIRSEKVRQLLGIAAAGQQATRDYHVGLQNLRAQEAAAKSDLAVQKLLEAAVRAPYKVARGGGGGGRVPDPSPVGRVPISEMETDDLIALNNRLKKRVQKKVKSIGSRVDDESLAKLLRRRQKAGNELAGRDANGPGLGR